MFAKVIVDVLSSDVDKIFEYSFSDAEITVGSLVKVPFGGKIVEGIVIACSNNSEYDCAKIKPVLSLSIKTPVLNDEMLALAEYMRKNCYTSRASVLRLFLPAEMRKGKVKEKLVGYLSLKEEISDSVFSELKKNAVKQRELLERLLKIRIALTSELSEEFGASAVKAVVDKGYAEVLKKKENRAPYKDLEVDNKNVLLTEKQKLAVESVCSSKQRTTLLYGVTGSGKTEVYLELIKRVIEKGKSAIMLVPEIALTPQMLKQLRARFGEAAAILHSGLSAGERYDEWLRLKNGQAKIAIGARSAVFAPLENVGIIIVDEEHDGSYVSESNPRYDTIDVANFRASYNDAKIVLGSATPSVKSFNLAKKGEYNLVELPDRINAKPLPEVTITDMRAEVRRGNSGPFSTVLKFELKKCLDSGNQAILFLNQRGFSKTVICAECGHVQKCTDCDVSLTYHMEDDALLCHYCGAKYKMIDACTECGSKFLRYGGAGTEKIVSDLKKLFPTARILRMDRDTTRNKESHFKILGSFAAREADILVGTQMIAKGHDFPAVTLVGILDADSGLYFSDYRSAERTFQLLTQVAGRSGRAEEAGKVVLQTYSPDADIFRKAINYDYEGFFEDEISIRAATGFPPFTDIVRVLVSGENEEKTLAAIKAIYDGANVIYANNKEKFRFFGCMKAPIKRIQKKYRYQVLMRLNCGNREIIDEIFAVCLKVNSRNVSVSLEINPNNLN